MSKKTIAGALLLTLAALPQANAQTPANCTRGGMASIINVSPNIAHPGDTITITHLGVTLGSTSCSVTNGQSYIVYPNGSNNIVAGPPTGTGLNGAQEYETNFTLINSGLGATLDCLSSPSAAAACSTVTLTYLVNSADENKALTFSSPRGISSGSVPASAHKVKFLAYSDGYLAGTAGSLTAAGQGNDEVLVINPCIRVTKECALPNGASCFPVGQPIVFSGVVSNCGDTELFGITVTDTQATNITFAATNSSGTAYDPNNGSLLAGETVTYTGSYIPAGSPACVTLSNTVTAVGFDVTGLGVTNSVSVGCPVCCPPNIFVSKGIICAPAAGISGCNGTLTYLPSDTGAVGPTNRSAFCYQIVVSNSGPDVLNNVTVVDDLVPGITNFPTTLAVGQSVTNYYSDSFGLSSGHATTNVNTVTATGTGASTGIVTNAQASATAIVVPVGANCSTPVLFSSLDQDGHANDNHVSIPAGSGTVSVTYSQVISNTGQADLNVTVTGLPALVDCNSGTPITIPNPIFIAAGGTYPIQGCFTPTCPTTSISVSVQGTAVASTNVPCIYDANGNAVTTATSSPCTARVDCLPKICVTKGVACAATSGVTNCDASLTYLPSDTGIAGPTNRTTFCYEIVVSNCGGETLTNVTLNDTLLADVSSWVIGTLAPGESKTNHYGQSYGLTRNGGATTNVNTVVATGTGLVSAIVVKATNSATAIVEPVSVACLTPVLHSDFDQDANNGGADGSPNDNNVTLPTGSTNVPVTYTEVITNTGAADLNVNISGLPTLYDCGNLSNLVSVPNPIFIPAGGSYTITGCILVSTCAPVNITLTLQGTAVANTNIPCIYDANGNAVTTASIQDCTATINCVQPVTCRVTGGGILEPGTSDQSCITVNTTILPLIVNGLPVDKITHGGQLGAPFSQMDCGAILGNPCIRGEWEHVRHYVGKGNPRDVIDMNFHSANPKGVFDSLSCACLGCCDPNTGLFIPPTVGPLIHKFALCNPDDHSICGPQPRPAPANAIIFSGVGTLTPTTDTGANNKAAVWVVFRVYIEDRSEPGGFHPKGSIDPADIYVFQAWKTDTLVSKKPNFNGIQTQFRKDLGAANCAFLDSLSSGALPIGSLPSPTVDGITADIQDMGPLYSGNHQIHPATDATCQ